MDRDLARRATAEAIGTAFLVAIVVGSGIYAQRLSPDDIGLQLLENSTATGAGLIALILAFGPVSGAHFNPVVTLADRLLGGISNRTASVYAIAQVVGGCVGAVVANLMFSLDAVNLSTHTRSSGGLWLGEFVATVGLLLVIFGVVRSGRSSVAPFAVGGYIAAAYWFTSSTSFANPAVTIARTLSNTFAGIRPSSAPAFIVVQIVAALCAVALIRFLHPHVSARDIVVPHETTESTPEKDAHMDAAALNGAVDRLTAEFGEVSSRDAIERLVASSLDQLTTAATTNAFVPLLAERFARQRLQALAKLDDTSPAGGLSAVLFLCVHNAGRSQMALGWFRHLAAGRAIAWSGGSEPGAQINSSAVAVMAEVGIDITGEFPKPWTDEVVRAADVVVTMGCGDACPFYPGKRYEDWELEDPAGQDVEAVRPIRDDIRDRVIELLRTLKVPLGSAPGF